MKRVNGLTIVSSRNVGRKRLCFLRIGFGDGKYFRQGGARLVIEEPKFIEVGDERIKSERRHPIKLHLRAVRHALLRKYLHRNIAANGVCEKRLKVLIPRRARVGGIIDG